MFKKTQITSYKWSKYSQIFLENKKTIDTMIAMFYKSKSHSGKIMKQ